MDKDKLLNYIYSIDEYKKIITHLGHIEYDYNFKLDRLLYEVEHNNSNTDYLLKDVETKVCVLNSVIEDYKKLLDIKESQCNHDLKIIIGDKEYNKVLSYCLLCDSYFGISIKNSKYYIDNKEINKDTILDLSNVIKNNLKNGYDNKVLKLYGVSDIVNNAKRRFIELLNDSKCNDIEYIKNEIKKEVLRVIENNYNKVTKKLSLE